jgi:hypothetical protein
VRRAETVSLVGATETTGCLYRGGAGRIDWQRTNRGRSATRPRHPQERQRKEGQRQRVEKQHDS